MKSDAAQRSDGLRQLGHFDRALRRLIAGGHGFTSIGAAITSLNVSPQSGDTIIVETGYSYPENVVVPSTLPGLTIEADTSQTPLVRDSGAGTGIVIDSSGVTISGLSIAGFATGIDVNSTSASISGNSIGGETTGVQFESAASGSVTGDTFSYTLRTARCCITPPTCCSPAAGGVSTGSNAFLGSTFIDNQSSQYINAVSNTFGGNTPSLANPGDVDYTIQDGVKDAVWYGSSSGLVRIVENNVYVTQANETNLAGAIPRGVAAAANARQCGYCGCGGRRDGQHPERQLHRVQRPRSDLDDHRGRERIRRDHGAGDRRQRRRQLFRRHGLNGFVIDASAVTIQSLTIDGSANMPLGADNYRTGIITNYVSDSSATDRAIVVNSVTIQNTNRKGVGLYNKSGEATGDVVENSTFSSIGAGTNSDSSYEGTYAIAAFQSDIDIENNTITGSAGGIGINSFDGTDFPLVTISGNTINSPSTVLSNGGARA